LTSLSAGDASSFRDPEGVLLRREGRYLRVVKAPAAAQLTGFLDSAFARRLFEEGRLPRTVILNPAETAAEAGLVLEHEPIPFPSFPYEWPPEMLHAAASLTLDLAEGALNEGFGLKDATPYNVLFRGAQPVFVDLLSFERREEGDPTWLPYAQFVRTFLLPLLADKHCGVPVAQALLSRRDGLEPEEVYRLLGPVDRISPRFLGLVSIPKWLGKAGDSRGDSLYRKRLLADKDKARFILLSLLRRLRRCLRRAEPDVKNRSGWSSYMEGGNNYSDEEFAAKEAFVQQVLEEHRPRRVLDAGCNTGHFSAQAARLGASVVAMDRDAAVAGETWRMARSRRLDILPLVVDLCRPTPATGWRNRECSSFLDRARGAFDAVLMLAVVHHMLVTERVPLEWIADLAAELTKDLLVIEFVPREDPMFRRLVRGREELHLDLTPEAFEAACRRHFELVRKARMKGSGRILYAWRRAGGRAA
jgi:SAM-dependent methyltransferase